MDKRDEKIDSIKEDLGTFYRKVEEYIATENLFIAETCTGGKYISNTGTIGNLSNFSISDKIYTNESILYITRYINGSNGSGAQNLTEQFVLCCYSDDDTVLEPANLESFGDYWKAILPNGTSYVRCSAH